MRPGAAFAFAAASAGVVACGGAQTTTILLTPPPAITVTETGTTSVGLLAVTVKGQPTRTFIVHGGQWRVCDSGTVTNAGSVTALDVRILATYIDKGVVVGQTTQGDAAADGGVLGNVAPGASVDFTFCAIAHNEPDVDRLVAVAVGGSAPPASPSAAPPSSG